MTEHKTTHLPYAVELMPLEAAQPWLEKVDDPESPLSPAERRVFHALKTQKRRLDWLAGRLAAKRLLHRLLAEQGTLLRLDEIEIRRRPNGEPYADVPGAGHLSISHTRRYALCVLTEHGSRVGADVEMAERRDPAWLTLVAHDSERTAALEEGDPNAQAVLWTRKEAVLKLLGLGLSAGLWDVRCLPHGTELHGKARKAWEDLGAPRFTVHTWPTQDSDAVVSVAVLGGSHGN